MTRRSPDNGRRCLTEETMSEQQGWAVMCSMTGSWGVARPEHAYHEDDGLLACTEWESLHDTWEEAMQYADTQARTVTVTVTLPRLAPEEWTTVGNFRVIPEPPGCGDALEVDELDHDGVYFVIGKEDCEPLALALLAHARKETN